MQKKTTVIISDSMLKCVSGTKLSRDTEKREKIEVKVFPGVTTNCSKHYIQPRIPKKPDRFVIHYGTNNLNSKDTPGKIVKDIIQLGKVVKMKKNDLFVSGICSRRACFN